MSDIEPAPSTDTLEQVNDKNRKKLKKIHPQVFDTQETTEPTQRANHPSLLQNNAVVSSNGSDNNLSISEEDVASMYD
jgi:hypothetical protein